ncbi:hypothetical protein [Ruminococcus albus]|uniref:Uncharacterized protein n=1 Tax=Ruminococcus albus TaxID=1264 RepID=A0A1H7P4L3_RUMAL|nr:hypothetical protein [Ruminococcus albus]SEL30559.1 hypothetical protein SAMN05216469_1194 [Ruminococcus albus]
MPRTRKVTTICNGRREVWTDYEQAKAYFLELMMSTEGEERDRAECVYIQLMPVISISMPNFLFLIPSKFPGILSPPFFDM